jgi:hypothetical protein
MDRVSPRKIHFAPYTRQQRAIDRMLREGEARNVTDVMRKGLDHDMDARGRPALSQQARQMAEDHERERGRDAHGDDMQRRSRRTAESW